MTLNRHLPARIGHWSAAHPWRAVLVWLVLTLAAFSTGFLGETRTATQADMTVGESARAAQLIEDNGLKQPATENFLISPRAGTNDAGDVAGAADELKQRLSGLSETAAVSGPTTSEDGRTLLLRATMKGDADSAPDRVTALADVTAEVQDRHPGLRVEETGDASIQHDFQAWLAKDMTKATLISVPITLVVLMVVFGALVTAGVPVLLALFAVGSSLSLWALASRLFPDPGMVPDVIVLMGLAVGVDYCLFYLRRYREERAKGYDSQAAVRVAAATSGHSVFVSGIAVLVSMAGLYLAGDLMLASMATGAIIVVAMAMVSTVTVLPALLVKLGRAVDRPRIPVLWRLTRARGGSRVWTAILRPATGHPAIAAVLSVGALLALAVPALGMDLKSTQLADFPRSLTTMQSYDRLVAAFPSRTDTDVVALRLPADRSADLRPAVRDLSGRIGQGAAGDRAKPEIRWSEDGLGAVLEVSRTSATGTEEARTAVRELRTLLDSALGGLPAGSYAVGGAAAEDMDYTANLHDRLPWVMAAVLALTFLVMLAAFRSVVIALTTVVLNLLSVAASFGILCLVFQKTWAEPLLDFTSTGHVVSWVPVLLFVILSGLSLDYHVFVVSRIRERVLIGMTTKNAVVDGISRTAGVVTGAALVMVAVFSVFGALSFVEMKQIGVGLAVAVALDATVIRAFVLPSLMVLLGRANWWPSKTGRSAAESSPVPEQAEKAGLGV
ncbi:MMPL family transporter [Streptomyces olivaceus]|uniref:MMPL family transporter n=1 Tax=Streptomyces olivaceus TaxID=47716 RepID=UPI001CCB754B|nr:MMPL family transporter [Streptomyces olivaceus]MBZ6248037.1 MMPL family transporter [Streptomyces olivaceus]